MEELKYSLILRFHDRETGKLNYERKVSGNNQLKMLTLIWHIAMTRDPKREYLVVMVDNCKERPRFLIKALRQHKIAIIEPAEPAKA
ncbi:MAG: hypothetical protein QW707_07340 [Candidatus Bathyarchaeia archaeon]